MLHMMGNIQIRYPLVIRRPSENMKPTNIDEYIMSQPRAIRPRLHGIRTLIHQRLPACDEALKWGNPSILHPDGMILVMFPAYKNHINIAVTPSAKEALADRLVEYQTGKATVKIPHEVELPVELIAALVDERIREYREDAIKWM